MAVPSAHTTYVRSGTARVKSEITVSYSRSLSLSLSHSHTHTLTSSQLHTFHKAKALCTSKWVLVTQQQSLTMHTPPHTLCRVHTLALCRISNTRTLPCVYWQYSTHTHTHTHTREQSSTSHSLVTSTWWYTDALRQLLRGWQLLLKHLLSRKECGLEDQQFSILPAPLRTHTTTTFTSLKQQEVVE